MNHRCFSLISHLRDGSRTVSMIASVVTVAFTMLILAPTAQAVQREMNKPGPLPEPTVETRFAEQMIELTERLKQWRSALAEDSLTPAKEADRGRREWGQIRSRLARLDRDVRAGLRDLGGALEQRNAPPVLLDRQQEQLQHYEQKYAELQELLDGLKGARGADEIAALDAVIAFLDQYPSQRAQRPFDPDDLPFENLQPLPDNQPGQTVADFTVNSGATSPQSPKSKTDQTVSSSVRSEDGAVQATATTGAGFDDPQWLTTSDPCVSTSSHTLLV